MTNPMAIMYHRALVSQRPHAGSRGISHQLPLEAIPVPASSDSRAYKSPYSLSIESHSSQKREILLQETNLDTLS